MQDLSEYLVRPKVAPTPINLNDFDEATRAEFFKLNKKIRRAVFQDENGVIYLGEWKDGKRDGFGTSSKDGATIFSGIWKEDKPWTGIEFVKEEEKYSVEAVIKLMSSSIDKVLEFTRDGATALLDKVNSPEFNFFMEDTGTKIVEPIDKFRRKVILVLSGERTSEENPYNCRYNGSIKNGLRNGKGQLTLPDGEIYYDGEFKDGKEHGYGIKNYQNGDSYEGEWANGLRHGKGTYYLDGKKYCGNFKMGNPEVKLKKLINEAAKKTRAKSTTKKRLTLKNLAKVTAVAALGYAGGSYFGQDDNRDVKEITKDIKDVISDIGEIKDEFEQDTVETFWELNDTLAELLEEPQVDDKNTDDLKDQKQISNESTVTYKILVLEDGSYEGETKNGKRHGRGKMIYINGDIYEGEHVNDKRHGKGNYFSTNGDIYEGEHVNDKRHGKGNYFFTNGNRYEGEFKDNTLNGKGIYYFADGVKFEGEYKNGVRNGSGTYYMTNGDRFEGGFTNDKNNGRGIYYFASGNRYEGEFKDDKIYGKGIGYFANGDRYEGEFKNGKYNGEGIFYSVTGDRYEGAFIDDKKHGKGIYYFANGDRYSGEYKDGVRNGEGIHYFANGDSRKQSWKNGVEIK